MPVKLNKERVMQEMVLRTLNFIRKNFPITLRVLQRFFNSALQKIISFLFILVKMFKWGLAPFSPYHPDHYCCMLKHSFLNFFLLIRPSILRLDYATGFHKNIFRRGEGRGYAPLWPSPLPLYPP